MVDCTTENGNAIRLKSEMKDQIHTDTEKLLLIDLLGRANGMERWHYNFLKLTNDIAKVKIFSNYSCSPQVVQKFVFEKAKKFKSISSILLFGLFFSPKKFNRIIFAHYGEAFNTLLFLPAILKCKREQRFLLIHDATSTLKKERSSFRNWITVFFDKFLFSLFNNLIIHNPETAGNFSSKRKIYLPLPPAINSVPAEKRSLTGKFVFWGFLKKTKNAEFIIDLAKIMPDKKFDIYGTFINNEYKEEFLEYFHKNALPNVAFYEKFIAEEEVAKLIIEYDAVLLPYTFITNSGILQMNADQGVVSITSDLPSFRLCSDISVNIKLVVYEWKGFIDRMDAEKFNELKKRVVNANQKRKDEFQKRFKTLLS